MSLVNDTSRERRVNFVLKGFFEPTLVYKCFHEFLILKVEIEGYVSRMESRKHSSVACALDVWRKKESCVSEWGPAERCPQAAPHQTGHLLMPSSSTLETLVFPYPRGPVRGRVCDAWRTCLGKPTGLGLLRPDSYGASLRREDAFARVLTSACTNGRV